MLWEKANPNETKGHIRWNGATSTSTAKWTKRARHVRGTKKTPPFILHPHLELPVVGREGLRQRAFLHQVLFGGRRNCFSACSPDVFRSMMCRGVLAFGSDRTATREHRGEKETQTKIEGGEEKTLEKRREDEDKKENREVTRAENTGGSAGKIAMKIQGQIGEDPERRLFRCQEARQAGTKNGDQQTRTKPEPRTAQIHKPSKAKAKAGGQPQEKKHAREAETSNNSTRYYIKKIQ